jgi:hypothetical protein
VGEDILSRNYILNKTPYKKLGKISYELFNAQSSSYKYIKVWGRLEKITVPPPKKVKIWTYYIRYETILEGYSDTEWISDIKNSKSINKFIFVIREAIVS